MSIDNVTLWQCMVMVIVIIMIMHFLPYKTALLCPFNLNVNQGFTGFLLTQQQLNYLDPTVTFPPVLNKCHLLQSTIVASLWE